MGRIKTTNNLLTRREIIIEKAATLFKEKGFKAASMREIADVVGVEAASLYNHIKSIFPPEKNTHYILYTTLLFTRAYNIIQPNSDVFREVQNITVTYQLIDKQSLQIITKGSFVKMNSYNVNFSLYANAVLRQDAMSGLAENAAEEIRNRLLMFFVKQ